MGACLGNPGPGGWACILRFGDLTRELWGSERQTTNNRMELTAALRGFEALREDCEVVITTDSEYLKNGITTWIKGWKRNGWKTAAKKPVINRDLWEQTRRPGGPPQDRMAVDQRPCRSPGKQPLR